MSDAEATHISEGPRLRSVAASDALRRIQRQSRIAVEDSQLVEDQGQIGGEIRLEQNLYVTRAIEQTVLTHLHRENSAPAPSVLVVGEAGYGKTSLLWRIFHVLQETENSEPWLIKATLLSLDPAEEDTRVRSAGVVWADELVAAAQIIREECRFPIVLLDTLDVLLHDETDRQALLDLLLNLKEVGARVVATCRPDEAKLLGFFKRPSVTLAEYQGEELNEAIERHIHRFYSDVDGRTRAEHQGHITELVASGFPLREVCANPLTLRMLFSLYAPAEPPSEVNVFDLYKKYWNQRVASDTRAGAPESSRGSSNLEAIAHFSSLTMLAEGKPELAEATLANGIRSLGGSAAELEEIVQRGVIHRQGTGTMAFFHQTFFEHSAARGLLFRFGTAGLVLLYRRLEARPNDLFLSPILEQSLLLAEEAIAPEADIADSLLLNLLDSDSLIATNAAVYVYAHRRDVPRRVETSFREVLQNGDSAVIKRYLEVAPNLPTSRLSVLFDELDIIWIRNIWLEQSHVLDLLERLAVRDPASVRQFLEQHSVRARVKDIGSSHQGGRRLLLVILALAHRYSEWSWMELIALYRDALDLFANDLQALIINSISRYTKFYGDVEIAARFAAVTTKFDHRKHFSVGTTSAFGRLWTRQWLASKLAISAIISECSQTERYFDLRAKLRGLADLLLTSPLDDLKTALVTFERELNNNLQWLWVRLVLPPLIRGSAWPEEGEAVESPNSIAATTLRNWVTSVLRNWLASRMVDPGGNGPHSQRELGVKAREALIVANLPPDTLIQVLVGEEFDDPAIWLDENLLGSLLGDAVVAGHASAMSAADQLIFDPTRFGTKLVSSLNSKLAEHATQGRLEFAEKQFELSIKAGDERSVAALVRTLQLPVKLDSSLVDRLSADIERLGKRLTNSSSTNAQRTGYRFWLELIKRDLCTVPTLIQLRELLAQVRDEVTQGLIANLMVVSASKRPQEFEPTVLELLRIANESRNDFLRRESLRAVERLIVDNPQTLSQFAEPTFDVAMTGEADAGIIGDFGSVIESLAHVETPIAYELFTRLVLSNIMSSLGTQAKKNLQHYLRRTTRAVVGAVSSKTRQQILDSLHQMDGYMQQLVIEAICHEAFTEVASRLNDLLNDDQVWDGTKEIIRRQKYMRERTRGGGAWPELYTIASNEALMENLMPDQVTNGNIQLESLGGTRLAGTLSLRLSDLADNVNKDLKLLKEYEDQLRFEDDPRRRAKCEHEIERLKASASSYQREYESLYSYVEERPTQSSVAVRSELHDIHLKLDALLEGQSELHLHLYQLRQAILNRYDASEQLIIESITERLDQAQVSTVQILLDAIELDRIDQTEMAAMMVASAEALTESQERGVALPEVKDIEEIISAPHLDVKHKLKFMIPIVPLLLHYEGEVELGSRVNLEAAWDRLVSKFRRN